MRPSSLLAASSCIVGTTWGIGVERDPDLRVAKAFLDHLGMDASGEQERGGGVSQVVETDGGQTGDGEQRLEVVDVEVGAPQRAAG